MARQKKSLSDIHSIASELEAHERECAIRYENIEKRLEAGSKKFVRFEQMIWGLYALIIATQIIGVII
jgi:hypothetical protein